MNDLIEAYSQIKSVVTVRICFSLQEFFFTISLDIPKISLLLFSHYCLCDGIFFSSRPRQFLNPLIYSSARIAGFTPISVNIDKRVCAEVSYMCKLCVKSITSYPSSFFLRFFRFYFYTIIIILFLFLLSLLY